MTVFIFLHICWGVLWFDAFEKKSYLKGAIVLVSHTAAALLVSCVFTKTECNKKCYFWCILLLDCHTPFFYPHPLLHLLLAILHTLLHLCTYVCTFTILLHSLLSTSLMYCLCPLSCSSFLSLHSSPFSSLLSSPLPPSSHLLFHPFSLPSLLLFIRTSSLPFCLISSLPPPSSLIYHPTSSSLIPSSPSTQSAFNLYFDRAVSAPVVLSVHIILLFGLVLCSLWTAGAKPTKFKYLFYIR